MRIALMARVAASLGVALMGAVLALPAPSAHALPAPSSAASVQEKTQRYLTARADYVAALEVYLSHNRAVTKEYLGAVKTYSAANSALQVAKREIAKTFKDAITAAQVQNRAALKLARTPEQRAVAANVYAASVAAAAVTRDDTTSALPSMPSAPPKVIKIK